MRNAIPIGIFSLTIILFSNKVIAQGLIIQNGSYLLSKNASIVLNKNWINNGSFKHNNQGSVRFGGNGIQLLGGNSPTNFFQLMITAGSSTHVSTAGHSVQYRILSDGELFANKGIRLTSTINSTALVDGSGTGEIKDSLLVEATIKRAFGYKYLGSPFKNAKVQDWADFINLSAAFPSIYSFDENQLTNGWNTYTNTSNPIFSMRGYAMQFDSSNSTKTITTHGVVNNGPIYLSLYNNNRIYTKGFELVSNPYPSPIDWDASYGWTKTNIDNAIYFFDSDSVDVYGGKYNSYINGVSSDGISNNIIPAMQAFFVHVSDGAYPVQGILGISNQVRRNQISRPYRDLGFKDNKMLLGIEAIMKSNGIADQMIIYCDINGAKKFNPHLDALKIMNTSTRIPSIYCIGADAKKMSIHAISFISDSTSIPLGISNASGDIIRLRVAQLDNFPTSIHIYIYDKLMNHYYELKANTELEFPLAKGNTETRFILVFSANAIRTIPGSNSAVTNFSVYALHKNIYLKIAMQDGEKALCSIINSTGQIVYRQTYEQGGAYQVNTSLSTGIYLVSLLTAEGPITKPIFIGE